MKLKTNVFILWARKQGILLDEEFDMLLDEVRETKPNTKVFSQPKSRTKDLVKILKRFVERNQEKWIEIFEDYDEEGKKRIPRAEFAKGLQVTVTIFI